MQRIALRVEMMKDSATCSLQNAQPGAKSGQTKKAGARKPRLSSWLCARIKLIVRAAAKHASYDAHLQTEVGRSFKRSFAGAPSGPAPAPECLTSAFRSAATNKAELRPRTGLPSTPEPLPDDSVLHRRADPAR